MKRNDKTNPTRLSSFKNRRTDIPIHKAKIDSRIGISTKYGEHKTITIYIGRNTLHTNMGLVYSSTEINVLHYRFRDAKRKTLKIVLFQNCNYRM